MTELIETLREELAEATAALEKIANAPASHDSEEPEYSAVLIDRLKSMAQSALEPHPGPESREQSLIDAGNNLAAALARIPHGEPGHIANSTVGACALCNEYLRGRYDEAHRNAPASEPKTSQRSTNQEDAHG